MKNNKRMTTIRLAQLTMIPAYELSQLMTKLKSLSRAHKLQCENACNGEGYIPRKGRFSTVATYGSTNHKKDSTGNFANPAYISTDQTVFDVEIERLEKAIDRILGEMRAARYASGTNLSAENWDTDFQHDPRGATVKITIAGHEFCPAFDF